MAARDLPSISPARHLLLIEDAAADAELFLEAVAELTDGTDPIQVVVARTWESAQRYLLRQPPHEHALRPELIFLDLNLPGEDGRRVLRSLKQSEDFRTIPLLVLTTSQSPEDVKTSYRNHANCYLVKPLDFRSFKRLVAETLKFWLETVILPS